MYQYRGRRPQTYKPPSGGFFMFVREVESKNPRPQVRRFEACIYKCIGCRCNSLITGLYNLGLFYI